MSKQLTKVVLGTLVIAGALGLARVSFLPVT